jgi:DNA processing protein
VSLDAPRFVSRDEVAALRPRLAPAVRFRGLWVCGDLAALAWPAVAIVGSRAPSSGGAALARAVARDLACAGVCIVSGLALGIDGAAHGGALDAGGATIGILGGGHRCFHPRRNRALAERMVASGGAVLSPYEPDDAARPWQFLQRNGIVAALADGVVIVEAAARSGALNTASWASDLGVPVFAFPGDVDRPKVAGCLALIRDGATLVRHANDVLADLGIGALVSPPPSAAPRSELAARILRALEGGERDADALIESCGASAAATLAALTRLELDGAIERRAGLRYARLREACSLAANDVASSSRDVTPSLA